jgi:farnesyl diphosphate synthase
MDDDDLRRGKPTCHKKFDEATAILAGDTLQAYAYEVLVKGSLKTKIPMEKILELVEDLGNASGFNGMAGGQMIDLQSEKAKTSLKELIRLHQLKTGCLLKFSIAAPAVVYGVDRRTKNILEQYADIIGLAFQIKDDILDVEGTAEELGKTPGKDSLEEKATFVKLLGLEKAKKYLIEEINKALAVAIYFGEGNILMDFAEYLLERKN